MPWLSEFQCLKPWISSSVSAQRSLVKAAGLQEGQAGHDLLEDLILHAALQASPLMMIFNPRC